MRRVALNFTQVFSSRHTHTSDPLCIISRWHAHLATASAVVGSAVNTPSRHLHRMQLESLPTNLNFCLLFLFFFVFFFYKYISSYGLYRRHTPAGVLTEWLLWYWMITHVPLHHETVYINFFDVINTRRDQKERKERERNTKFLFKDTTIFQLVSEHLERDTRATGSDHLLCVCVRLKRPLIASPISLSSHSLYG